METVRWQNPYPDMVVVVVGIRCDGGGEVGDIVALAFVDDGNWSVRTTTTDHGVIADRNRIDDGTHSPTRMIKECVL